MAIHLDKSAPWLTLPPEVGRKYRYKNTSYPAVRTGEEGICVIKKQNRYKGRRTWKSHSETDPNDSWTYWEDGSARLGDGDDPKRSVAHLIEDYYDIPPLKENEEFAKLSRQIEWIKRRVKALEA